MVQAAQLRALILPLLHISREKYKEVVEVAVVVSGASSGSSNQVAALDLSER